MKKRDFLTMYDLFGHRDRTASTAVRQRTVADDRPETGLFQAPFGRQNEQMI